MVFQIRFSIILILSFLLLGSSTLIPNSSAQEDIQIPDWVKNNAKWWADGKISEKEFLTGIEYLINNNIISIDFIPCSINTNNQAASLSAKMVPDWVKNNAKWWSEDLIVDTDFINGLQYLVKKQIIKIDNKKILGKVPLEDVSFSPAWLVDKNHMVFVQSSFFEVYGKYGDCSVEFGESLWRSLTLGLNPNKMDMYNEVAVWDEPKKTAVVFPFFTTAAYSDRGFYAYYNGQCDDCITTKFVPPVVMYSASGVGHQALTLLGYSSITDVDIDKNPSILQQFDKIIMLHNEYVTRTMFDAITNHPNVLYLYPNALYAEIEVDYIDETITLIRGHNYPEPEIANGFDWEFDNTHPYEYDNLCADMKFYQIENGWMTTCYPENIFLEGKTTFSLLKIIKDL